MTTCWTSGGTSTLGLASFIGIGAVLSWAASSRYILLPRNGRVPVSR